MISWMGNPIIAPTMRAIAPILYGPYGRHPYIVPTKALYSPWRAITRLRALSVKGSSSGAVCRSLSRPGCAELIGRLRQARACTACRTAGSRIVSVRNFARGGASLAQLAEAHPRPNPEILHQFSETHSLHPLSSALGRLNYYCDLQQKVLVRRSLCAAR